MVCMALNTSCVNTTDIPNKEINRMTLVSAFSDDKESNYRMALLLLRLVTLVFLVSLLTVHLRSLRVFRWEQSVSGGVLVTYCISTLGLVLCAGRSNSGGITLQYFLCLSGALLLIANAVVIMRRWKTAGELTRVVCELLGTLGLKVKRQIMQKVVLSALAAIGLIIDLTLIPFFKYNNKK